MMNFWIKWNIFWQSLNNFWYDIKKKNGYILCAIDGAKIEIPNTPLNRERFGSEGNQHKQKTARALLSGIIENNKSRDKWTDNRMSNI